MSQLNFTQKVAKIQKELKAPKNQRNKFGNYNYRNCEDILEAVKPLLGDLVLTLSDEVVERGGRVYVVATAQIADGEGSLLSNQAFAREPDAQKGMSESQLTGTASSYARKYALNGLFLIDDTKDADTNEFQGAETPKKQESKATLIKQEATSATASAGLVKTETKPITVQSAEVKATETKKGGWGKKTTPKQEGDLY